MLFLGNKSRGTTAHVPRGYHLRVCQQQKKEGCGCWPGPQGRLSQVDQPSIPKKRRRSPEDTGVGAPPCPFQQGLLGPVQRRLSPEPMSKSPARPGTLPISAPRCVGADWERNQKYPVARRDEKGSLPVIMKIFTVADAWRKLKNNTTKFTNRRGT